MRVIDGRPIAVSGSRDATLRVWNIETGEAMHVLSGHSASVRCIEVSGNKVVSGSYDSTCRVSYFLSSSLYSMFIILELMIHNRSYGTSILENVFSFSEVTIIKFILVLLMD